MQFKKRKKYLYKHSFYEQYKYIFFKDTVKKKKTVRGSNAISELRSKTDTKSILQSLRKSVRCFFTMAILPLLFA